MGVEAVDAANLIGLFVGAVLFGLYNGLFLLAMVNIRSRRTGSRVVPLLLIAIWIVTVSLTVLRSISYCSALEKEKTDPQHFRQKFKRKYSAMFPLLQFFSILLSDILICWRLYVVWNRRRVILVVPILLMMGLTVCGGMVCKLSFLSARKGSSYPGYENWLTAFSTFTLSVNILVTTLICWKIWRIGKEIPPGLETSSRRYHSIMHALIESGGIYSVAQILYTVFRLFKVSIGVTFMMHVLPQVVGIAPTLIVIRLHSLSLLQPYDTGSPPPQQLQSLRKVTCEGVFVKPPNLPESHNPSETQHDPEGRSVQVTIISVI